MLIDRLMSGFIRGAVALFLCFAFGEAWAVTYQTDGYFPDSPTASAACVAANAGCGSSFGDYGHDFCTGSSLPKWTGWYANPIMHQYAYCAPAVACEDQSYGSGDWYTVSSSSRCRCTDDTAYGWGCEQHCSTGQQYNYNTQSCQACPVGWTWNHAAGMCVNTDCVWPQVFDAALLICVDPQGTCDHAPGWQVSGPSVAAGIENTPGVQCMDSCIVYGDHFEPMPDGSGVPWYVATGGNCDGNPDGTDPEGGEVLPLGDYLPVPEPLEPTPPPTADPTYEKLEHIDWRLGASDQKQQQIVQQTKETVQQLQTLNQTMTSGGGGGGGAGCGTNGIPCTWDSSGTAATLPDALTGWNALKADFNTRVDAAMDELLTGLGLSLPGGACSCGSGVTVMGININICVCDYMWALEVLAVILKVVVGISVIMILLGI